MLVCLSVCLCLCVLVCLSVSEDISDSAAVHHSCLCSMDVVAKTSDTTTTPSTTQPTGLCLCLSVCLSVYLSLSATVLIIFNTTLSCFCFFVNFVFRLQLFSEDSYLLEGLQSAVKTKMHQKSKLQNAPTFNK